MVVVAGSRGSCTSCWSSPMTSHWSGRIAQRMRMHTAAGWVRTLKDRQDLEHIEPLSTLMAAYPVESLRERHFIYGSNVLGRSWTFDMFVKRDETAETLWAVVDAQPGREFSLLTNAQGTLHGGAIATIFDGVMGALFTRCGCVPFAPRQPCRRPYYRPCRRPCLRPSSQPFPRPCHGPCSRPCNEP